MKFFYRISVLWLISTQWLQQGTLTSLENDVIVSASDLNAPGFYHLAIHKDKGTVFMDARDRVYKLTADLKPLASQNVTLEHNGISYDQIFEINYERNQLIVCGFTDYTYRCTAYDFTRKESKLTLTKEMKLENLRKINESVPIASFLDSINDSNNDAAIFKIPKLASNLKRYSTPLGNSFKGDIVLGFDSGIYNYFITQQSSIVQNGSYISKLVRICDDGKNGGNYWRGYAEIPIECKNNEGQSYDLVQAAHVGKPNVELKKSLNNGSDDDVLFAVFSKSQAMEAISKKPSAQSALCIYSLNAINKKFTENIQNCFNGNGYRGLMNKACEKAIENIDLNFCSSEINMPLDGNMPVTESSVITFNTFLTAIATKQNENHNDVFLGTKTGHLKKIVLYDSENVYEHADLPIDEGSPVNSELLFSPKKDYLYIMTKFKLTRVKVEQLYSHKDYLTCILLTSKSCGWCRTTNECTLESECRTNSSSWYENTPKKTIRVTENSSNHLQIDRDAMLQLLIVNLPVINDRLYCRFFIENRTLQTTVISLRNTSTSNYIAHCPTPEYNKMPKVPKNANSLKARLHIATNGFNDITMTEITFFDCNTYITCEACVSSMFSCQWDSKARKCSYGEENIVDKVFIINDVDHRNTCPDTTPPRISRIWPEAAPYEGATNITIEGESLGFKFEHINQGIQVAGVTCTPYSDEYVPKKTIKCVINKSSSFPGCEGPVVIHLNGKYIESTQHFKFVDPKIVNISPKKGPTYGGTVLTIKGKNLTAGKSKEVFIGNTFCTVFSSESSAIQCITESSHIEKEEMVFVKFDETFRNFTNDSFKYFSDPQKDEDGFNYELKGIPTGGIKMLIRDLYPNPQPPEQLLIHTHDGKNPYKNSCTIRKNSTSVWICLSPPISNVDSDSIDAQKPIEMNVSFTDIGKSQNFFTNQSHKFLLYPNPKFDYFFSSAVEYSKDTFLFIKGQNIDLACQKSDINVKVGADDCEIKSISSDQIICILKFMRETTIEQQDYMEIDIGGHLIRIKQYPGPKLENSNEITKYII